MFKKNTFSILLHRFLLLVFFPLLALVASHQITVKKDFSDSKKTTASQKINVVILNAIIPKSYVGSNDNELGITDEFICEERCDDETKEIHVNYPSNLLISLLKPTTPTSSKEYVYYNSDWNYNKQVSLYTLFCSWKSYLI